MGDVLRVSATEFKARCLAIFKDLEARRVGRREVAVGVVLDDVGGHDIYQEHPLHTQFIQKHKQNWKRVQVYDFV